MGSRQIPRGGSYGDLEFRCIDSPQIGGAAAQGRRGPPPYAAVGHPVLAGDPQIGGRGPHRIAAPRSCGSTAPAEAAAGGVAVFLAAAVEETVDDIFVPGRIQRVRLVGKEPHREMVVWNIHNDVVG